MLVGVLLGTLIGLRWTVLHLVKSGSSLAVAGLAKERMMAKSNAICSHRTLRLRNTCLVSRRTEWSFWEYSLVFAWSLCFRMIAPLLLDVECVCIYWLVVANSLKDVSFDFNHFFSASSLVSIHHFRSVLFWKTWAYTLLFDIRALISKLLFSLIHYSYTTVYASVWTSQITTKGCQLHMTNGNLYHINQKCGNTFVRINCNGIFLVWDVCWFVIWLKIRLKLYHYEFSSWTLLWSNDVAQCNTTA